MKQEMRMGSEMPKNFVMLFERIIRVEGKLAKQQFWGETGEGCDNTFAMKYEIIEEEKNIFGLLADLGKVMQDAKEKLVEKERYEEAQDLKELLETLFRLNNRRK